MQGSVKLRLNSTDYVVAWTKAAEQYTIIQISAKRWFNSRIGSTYHSVTVSGLNKQDQWVHIGYIDYAYGYGEEYLTTATKILIDAGLLQSDTFYALSGWSVRADLGQFIITCDDVNRKKDL